MNLQSAHETFEHSISTFTMSPCLLNSYKKISVCFSSAHEPNGFFLLVSSYVTQCMFMNQKHIKEQMKLPRASQRKLEHLQYVSTIRIRGAEEWR
jgi:hypothetical protein